MLAFSTNQLVILLLVLVLGLFIGLALRSGGRKWRKGFEAERNRRIQAERDRDAHLARILELEGERDRLVDIEKDRDAHLARVEAANARIAELERGRPAVTAGTAASIAAAASGKRDDLARIYGVGRSGEERLNDIGVHRYIDIVSLEPADEARLEGRLGAAPGTIAEQRWREQADLLNRGRYEEHAKLFA